MDEIVTIVRYLIFATDTAPDINSLQKWIDWICSVNWLSWIETLSSGVKEALKSVPNELQIGGDNVFIIGFTIGFFALTAFLEVLYRANRSGDIRNLFFVLYEFNIRQKYICQPSATHETLFSGISCGLRGDNGGIVLLLAVGRGARCTAIRLALAAADAAASATSIPAAVILRGQDFSSPDDYWIFRTRIRENLSRNRVAVVSGFELLHPQVATTFSNLTGDPLSPQHNGSLLLILDTGERFSQLQLSQESPTSLAEVSVRECLGPFLDTTVLANLVRAITWRVVLVFNDPRHKPSLCPSCCQRD